MAGNGNLGRVCTFAQAQEQARELSVICYWLSVDGYRLIGKLNSESLED
jgi:hypothetical protein